MKVVNLEDILEAIDRWNNPENHYLFSDLIDGSVDDEREEDKERFNSIDCSLICDDFDAMKQVILAEPSFYPYASERLKSDKQFNLSVTEKNGEVIQYFSEELRDDRQIAEASLSGKWYGIAYVDGFKYLSERLRDDKELALKVIKANPSKVKYLSERLQNDKDIIAEISRVS